MKVFNNTVERGKGLEIDNGYLRMLLLSLIFLAGLFLRIEHGKPYRENLFSTECALRFSYAKLVSENKPIPLIDYKAQYPEGLDVRARNPVLMEYTVGSLYRLLGLRMPFIDFVKLFLPLWASFSILAVYFLVKEFSRHALAGLTAAFFYAVSPSAIVRATGWEFLHETFALTLLFFHILFFVKALRQKPVFFTFFSGIFLFFALASWDISQFYFFIFMIFIALVSLLKREEKGFAKSFIILLAFVALAATIPFLRNGNFACSFAMIIAYSVLCMYAFKYSWLRRYASPAVIFFAAIALFCILLPNTQRYTHVYGLIFYKIRFLGIKPFNPALLPFEVRALWVRPFTSPSLFTLLYQFFPLLLVALIAFGNYVSKMMRGKAMLHELFFTYNTVVFFLLFLLIERFHIFLVFFVILLVGQVVATYAGLKRKDVGILLLVFCCLFVESRKSLLYRSSDVFAQTLHRLGIKERYTFSFLSFTDVMKELIDWLKGHTRHDEVIFAHYLISPVINAYSQRAVNLTSIFESPALRKKVEEFTTALYASEEELYRLCKRYGTDYVVYSCDTIIDDSLYSWRYLADRMRLNEDMAAYKMHFFPEKLKRFSLKYENELFRVYEVSRGEPTSADTLPDAWHPHIYRYELFQKLSASPARLQQYVETAYTLYIAADQYFVKEQYPRAQELYLKALGVLADFPEPYLRLGMLAELQRDRTKAILYYSHYLQLNPQGRYAPEVRGHLEKIETPR